MDHPTLVILGSQVSLPCLGEVTLAACRFMVISLVLLVIIPVGVAVMVAGLVRTRILELLIVQTCRLDTTIRITIPALIMLAALGLIRVVVRRIVQVFLLDTTIPTQLGIRTTLVVVEPTQVEELLLVPVFLLVIIIHTVVGIRTMIVGLVHTHLDVRHPAQVSQPVTIIPIMTPVLTMDVELVRTPLAVHLLVLEFLPDFTIRILIKLIAVLTPARLDITRLEEPRPVLKYLPGTIIHTPLQVRIILVMLVRIRLELPQAARVCLPDTTIHITTGIPTMAAVLVPFLPVVLVGAVLVTLARGQLL